MNARHQLPLELPPAADHWSPPLRHWRMRYEFAGLEFVWTGRAVNAQAADRLARYSLEVQHGDYFRTAEARQIACVEARP